MPITKSAKKALRQNVRRRERNLLKKEAFRSAIKTYKRFVAEKKTSEAETDLRRAYQALDKAAKTGVIAKNKASRTKARLSRLLR